MTERRGNEEKVSPISSTFHATPVSLQRLDFIIAMRIDGRYSPSKSLAEKGFDRSPSEASLCPS
jgi:hypothetical protein